jgi:hypothetical protein
MLNEEFRRLFRVDKQPHSDSDEESGLKARYVQSKNIAVEDGRLRRGKTNARAIAAAKGHGDEGAEA